MNRKMKRALRNQIEVANNKILMMGVIHLVSTRLKVKIKDMKGPSRLAPIVEARQLSQYIISQISNIPESQISDFFNQHHSTVIYSIDRVEELLEVGDEQMTTQYQKCIQTI